MRACLGLSVLLAFGFSSLGAARAGVIVVDPGGGPGQALLQAAIDSAVDGDVIVLKTGQYSSPGVPITIVGKAITIVGDTAPALMQVRGMFVSRVPAGRDVVLEYLYLGEHDTSPEPGFTSGLIADLSGGGGLRLQGCWVTGSSGWFDGVAIIDYPPYPAALVSGDGDASFLHCRIMGGHGHHHFLDIFQEHHWPQPGMPALIVDGSRVALHFCPLSGGYAGSGPDAGSDPLPDGGSALVLRNGAFAYTYGQTFTGGSEGGNPEPGCTSGDAIRVEASGGEVWVRGTTLVPGSVQAPGTSGLPINLLGGSSTSFTEPVQIFADGDKNVYHEGESLLFFTTGHPGDAVLMFLSVQSGFVPLSKLQGVLGLSPTLLFGPIPLGVVGAVGYVQLPAIVPNLPAAFDSLLVFWQTLEMTPGGPVLGAPRTIVLLDASIP